MRLRRMLFGAALGALMMHAFLFWSDDWMQSFGGWIGGTASGYRGDATHQRAREALR